jgi:hypothetical protein
MDSGTDWFYRATWREAIERKLLDELASFYTLDSNGRNL